MTSVGISRAVAAAILLLLGHTGVVKAEEPIPQAETAVTAAAANPWSVYLQAQAYERGTGVKRSWKRARSLYEQAMAGGAIEVRRVAAFTLGNHYTQPNTRNYSLAARFFKQGSELNDPWSTFKLAELYENGRGVKKSTRQARNLYLKVASGTNREASKYAHLAVGKIHMRKPLLDHEAAKGYFLKALDQGEVWSAYFLIEIYGQRKRSKANRERLRQYLSVLRNSKDKKAQAAARTLAKRYRISTAS